MQTVQDKITALHITTQIIIGFVYFLTFGKPDMHIIGFGSDVKTILQHGKLHTDTCIIRAFVFALDIERTRDSHQILIFMQQMRTSLSSRHYSFGHISKTGGIEQRRDMPIVAQRFSRQIHRTSSSVEESYLISELFFYHSVKFETNIKTGSYIRSNGIQRIRHNNR